MTWSAASAAHASRATTRRSASCAARRIPRRTPGRRPAAAAPRPPARHHRGDGHRADDEEWQHVEAARTAARRAVPASADVPRRPCPGRRDGPVHSDQPRRTPKNAVPPNTAAPAPGRCGDSAQMLSVVASRVRHVGGPGEEQGLRSRLVTGKSPNNTTPPELAPPGGLPRPGGGMTRPLRASYGSPGERLNKGSFKRYRRHSLRPDHHCGSPRRTGRPWRGTWPTGDGAR